MKLHDISPPSLPADVIHAAWAWWFEYGIRGRNWPLVYDTAENKLMWTNRDDSVANPGYQSWVKDWARRGVLQGEPAGFPLHEIIVR